MNEQMLWILAAVIAAVIVVIIIAAVLIRRKRKRESGDHRVVMSDGIDVNTQKRGSESGALFQNLYEAEETDALGTGRSETYRLCLMNILTAQKYELCFRHSVGIGRAANVQSMEHFVTIADDAHISGLHCRIFVKNRDIYIEDLKSTNYTYVNDRVIEKPCPLKDGDVIRIGSTSLKVIM